MTNTELLVLNIDYLEEMCKQVDKVKDVNIQFILRGISSIQHFLKEYVSTEVDIPLERRFDVLVYKFITTSKSKLDEDYKNIIFFNIKNLQIQWLK